jgi:two-component system CheB/CheR fusion protein
MSPDSGLSFVVILHLPIDRRSMLPEILQRWTAMRVIDAQDGVLVEPDCIFVPPPHAAVTLVDGRLRIRMPGGDEPRDYRPIDGFFDSLAQSLGEEAVGIVLSGTGSDGALGLKAIKQNGGLTMAQGSEGTRPQYDSMPAGAIATGAVDLIAPAETMPRHLLTLRPIGDEASVRGGDEPEVLEALRLAICTTMREQLGA